jgi:tetratricopeptide (TPR) repeat protein
MTDGGLLLKDLRMMIASGNAAIVVGAEMSIQASEADVASWTGLLRHGIGRCEELFPGRLPQGWGQRQREAIDSADMDELLGVAEAVSRRLGAPDGGEFRRWLRETIGRLEPLKPDVIHALVGLGCTVLTTNYDDLIESVTGWNAVTWQEAARVERVVRRDAQAVIHLHGHWERPESVILGIRSYERVMGDAHTQALLHALRALRTLVFVGHGAGLGDPNFEALLRWSRGVFAGSENRHFRLVTESDLASVQRQHPPEERVCCLSYGTHGDLVGFLRSLRPALPPGAGAGTTSALASLRSDSQRPLPPRPACVGHDVELSELTRLLTGSRCAVRLQGLPGVGKSTVALAALHAPDVAGRFGPRRTFARCDGAGSAAALVSELARLLGVRVREEDPLQSVLGALRAEPYALVLDNFESLYDVDPDGGEGLLQELVAIPSLALVVTTRQPLPAVGAGWWPTLPLEILPLDDLGGRELFERIAERTFDDAELRPLLRNLGGLPLAIELMAYAAREEPTLADLRQSWKRERTSLLRRAGTNPHSHSLSASLELSIRSRRMTEDSMRLLSLLALLPDGTAHEDLDAVVPGVGRAAARVLRAVGLASYEVLRLRLLALVRKYVRDFHPAGGAERRHVIEHYFRLVRDLGPKAGAEGGAEAVARLSPEMANVEAMLRAGFEDALPEASIDAAIAWSEFGVFAGLGTALPREPALYEPALYRSSPDLSKRARLCTSLGTLALARSDPDAARALFDEALLLFRRVGDVRGEAKCILSLGNIALERSDYDAARARFDEALPLFRRVADVRGEANCILSLGNIALERSDHDAARARFDEALPLFRRVGDVLGEANCIQSLGEVALRRSDPDAARARFEEALSLYHSVGDVLGEANCIRSLGDIALERTDPDAARALYEEALRLYERIRDPYSVGQAHRALARAARDDHERDEHMARAREAWLSIGRADLADGIGVEDAPPASADELRAD